MRTWRPILTLAVALAAPACFSITLSVATPTALERQLLGEYESLDKDLVLASSVRGGAGGAKTVEAARLRAVRARALQRFNEDDLLELKAAGCVAEGLAGRLVSRPCEAIEDDASTIGRRRARVVSEENEARAQILGWVAKTLAEKQGRSELSAEGKNQYDPMDSAWKNWICIGGDQDGAPCTPGATNVANAVSASPSP